MASAVIPQINQSSHLSTNQSGHIPRNQSSHQQINQSSQQSIHQSTLTSEEFFDLGAEGSQEQYSCKFCKKLYSSPHSLRTHEKWHTGDLKHKCSFCDKKFRNPSELKRHEMTHTGERPHKCPHCSMKFIQKTSLREHIEKKHPLEQPLSDDPKPPFLDTPTTASTPHTIPSAMEPNQLSCKFCQKAFTDKQSLLQHEEKEAKEFEALHESFEEAEFKELDNFGLQDYLPHGLPDVKALTGVDFGTFMDQLETAEMPDLGPTLPSLNQKSALSSGFNNNNNVEETGLKMLTSSGDAQLFHNFVPDLSEDKNSASTFLQIPVNGLAKIEVKLEESKPVVLNELQDIKVEQKPSPGFQTAPEQIRPKSANTQPFNTPNQVKIELDIKPDINLLPPTNSSESDTSENEDAIIQQYFDELEGQFPHLRGNLAPTTLAQTNMSPVPNYQTILVQHSVLKSESDQIISADSPRYTGASTPVDTIQASSLTQLSPPIYNNASRLSPLQNQPNSIVNLVQNNTSFVPVSNQAVISRPPQTDHINSLLQSNPDQTLPMARTPLNVNSTTNDLLPTRSIQASVLPAAPVETFQTVHTVELPQQQYYQTVQIDTNHPPVYQIQDTGQIDPYTEGILNQIEGKISNWTELSYTGTFHTSQDSNELFTVTSISSKNPSQIVAIQQPQVCSANLPSGESYQVHTTYFDENGQQYEPVNGHWSQTFESNSSQIGQSGNLQVIQLPNQAESEINIPGGPWVTGKPSLPKSWKMRTVESSMGTRMIKKSQFLAPDGQFFESRKSALDHMIRAGVYTNEDIDTMRKGLRNKTSFEWESGGEYVPPGWKTREKISTDNKTRLFFLSPGGISFPSRRAAFDHMIKDGKYSKVDIDTMKAGLRSRRMERKDFIVGDPSVPVGWKIRINDQMKESFRSPSGVFFHSRQTVLEHLIKEGYPQTDIALVQSKLTLGRKKRRKRSAAGDEKWIDNDQTVPGGWKMRVVNCSDGHAVTFFKTPDGTTLKGRKAALDHMLKTGVYSEKDIDIMKSHLNVISRVSDMWVAGDPTLPTGWKIKKYKSKTSVGRVHCEYLSPQNHVFRSRKAVVEHMRKTGAYSKEDILKVEAGNTKYKGQKRLLSIDDGWIESEALPKGWKLKRHLEGEQRIFKYLSPCGKEVWSHEAMLEEISKSGNCSQEDMEKLYRIVGSPTKTPQTMPSVSSSISAFSLTPPSVSKSPSVPVSLASSDLTLPPSLSEPTSALMSPIKNDLIPSTNNPEIKKPLISQSSMQSIQTSVTNSLEAAPPSIPSSVSATVQATILSSKLPSCTRVSILPSSLETTVPPSATQQKTTQLILEPNPNLKASVSTLNSSGPVVCSSASQNILNSQILAKPAKITQMATKSTHLIKKPIPSAVNNNLASKIQSPSFNSFFATKSAPPPKPSESTTQESLITVLPKNEIKSSAFSTLLKELPNSQNPQNLSNEQNKNKLLPSLRPHHETIISKLKEERLPKLKNSELGWKTGNSTLPQGWKVRTHFWWDREKQTFMAPDGTVFGSRKAVLKQMEADGSYDDADFEKVKRGLKRKGRRKQINQKKEEMTDIQKEELCDEEMAKLMKYQESGEVVKGEEGMLSTSDNRCHVLEKGTVSFEKSIEVKNENKIEVSESQDDQVLEKYSEDRNKMEEVKIKMSQDKQETQNDELTGNQENKEEKSKPVRNIIAKGFQKQSKSNGKGKVLREGRKNCIKREIGKKTCDNSVRPNTSWNMETKEVDIEEELDNVAEAEILKEIEEDEIMNDAEEVEILQQEKKIKLLSEINVEKFNKISPCFVKIFKLDNTQMKI